MASVRDHRDLIVWQKAVDLATGCYQLARRFPSDERFGLTAQLRSAATSVAANIAEGNGRLTRGEYVHHLSIARGSLREVDALLEIALRLGYAPPEAIDELRVLVNDVAALLTRLIISLRRGRSAPNTSG